MRQQDIALNIPNNNGYTPLNGSARFGYDDVVQELISHERIEVNVATHCNSTPVGFAAFYGHKKVLDLVLKNTSAEFLNKVDKDGETPLTMAVKNGHEDIVDAILRHPHVNVSMKDELSGTTPLAIARGEGNQKIIALLEQKL